MVTAVTQNIDVSVETFYLDSHSKPDLDYYLYAYHITIRNKGEFTVQLLTRHWDIFDSSMELRTVDGKGVVGDQPVIEPGESYNYESFCQLKTDSGTMKGYYTFRREIDNYEFDALIPEFILFPDYRNN